MTVCAVLATLAAVLTVGPAYGIESRHSTLHAVPAPGTVAVDGKLGDWDLSGHIECFPSFRMRGVYAAQVAVMYDNEFLYVAAVWRDSTPMQNLVDPDSDGNGWKGDCLQLRLITDVTLHVDCWYAAAAKRSVVKILYGTLNPGEQNVSHFEPFPKPNATEAGAQQAFSLLGEDFTTYAQEIALPWKLITAQSAIVKETGKPYAAPKVYQAGDTFTLGLDFGWGGPDGRSGTRVRHADLIKEGAVTRGANYYWADDACWGTVKLEPAGRLKLPEVDWQAMIDLEQQKTAGPIALSYTMPSDGYATLVVEDQQGLRVKNLIAMAPRKAGKQTDYWDGTGEDGNPAPPGKYRWRGLVHKGIEPVYAASYGSPGTGEPADGTGAWLSDRNPPTMIAAGKDMMVLAAERAERGASIVCVDLDGRRKWGSRAFSAIKGVTTDDKYVFVLTCADGAPPALARLDAATGQQVTFATKDGPKLTMPILWPNEKATDLPGITVVGDKVAVATPELIGIRLFDKETGAMAGGWRVTFPRSLTRDVSGTSWAYVVQYGVPCSLSRLDEKKQTLTLGIPVSMDRPVHAAVDEKRDVFFMLDRPANQVRVYNMAGKFLHSIGAKGGRPASGAWKADGMWDPTAIAVDSRGQVWVVEKTTDPVRVSVWSSDGRFQKEFISVLGGGAGANVDSDDATRVFAGGCEFKLDYKTGRAKIVACGLGDVSGQLVKANGREYFMSKQGKLYLRTGDTLKAVAAMAWFPWMRAKEFSEYPIAFTVEWELNGDPSGHHGNVCGSSFLWMDLNDDGLAQDDETIAGSRNGRTVGWKYPFGVADRGQYWLDEQFNLYACGYEIGYYYPPSMGPLVSRIPFKGWTPGGAPIWDVKKHEMVIGIMKSGTWDMRYAGPSEGFEVILPNGQSLFPNGQAMVYLPAEGKVVVGPPLTCVRDDGKILWTYKDDWAGPLSVFWQTTVPISDRNDVLCGTMGCIGRAKTKLGTIFAMPSSTGRLHLMTMDGLLVASIFQDYRVSRDWPSEMQIGTPLGNATMGANWSGRFFQAGKSDYYYLIAGSTACNVIRLNGIDSLKAIAGGEVTVASN